MQQNVLQQKSDGFAYFLDNYQLPQYEYDSVKKPTTDDDVAALLLLDSAINAERPLYFEGRISNICI